MPPTAPRSVEERLRLVATLADRLNNHPIVVGQAGIQLKVNFSPTGVSTTLHEPDEHLLRSLLVEVRPFLLEGDDCNLAAIHNLAIRHTDDPELVHAIESAKAAYKTNRRTLGFNLNINGTDLRPDVAADLWLNGIYFHTDVAKERQISAHVEPVSTMVRYYFLDFIIELTMLIVWTGSVLKQAFDRGVIHEEPVAPALAHPHRPSVTAGDPQTDATHFPLTILP